MIRRARLGAWSARATVVSWLLLGLLLARARADDAGESAAYRETVEEAISEYDLQHYPEARALFLRAHALSPNARTLRGLGLVAFELRDYAECLTYLEQALAERRRPLTGALRTEVDRLRARARGFVAELRLEVTPREAEIRVDDRPRELGPGGLLRLEIGEHEIAFEAEGYRAERRSLVVRGGESETWSISLRSAAAGEVSSARSELPAVSAQGDVASAARVDDALPDRARLRGWHKAVGATAIVLGAASFGVAGVLTSKWREHGRELRDTVRDTPAYRARGSRWDDARIAPFALGALGALGVVAAASGALGLTLRADRRAFPAWAAGLTAAAGAGLALWGGLEIAGGRTCGPEDDLRRCSSGEEQRELGALLVLASVPPLTVALAQLTRLAFASRGEQRSGLRVAPQVRLAQRALLLRAEWQWL